MVWHDFSDADIAALRAVLQSQQLVSGPFADQLEGELARICGAPHCAVCSSGTAALHLALLACGIGAGDSVVVPAATFVATVNVLEAVGARPIFVDINPRDFNIELEALEELLLTEHGQSIKAILPVHMFGVPFDVEYAKRLAQVSSAVLIEDAANALGAKWNGRPVGSLGDVAAFSFHPRKSFTTGEGGAVVSTAGYIDAAVRAWRNHGLKANGRKMECVVPGLNYRLSELAAAIGVVQSAHLRRVIAKRTELAQRYVGRLEHARGCCAQAASPGADPSWSSMVVVVDPGVRLRVMAKLDEAGVDSTIASYCVPSQPFYRAKYGTTPDDFPAARRLADGGITLPLHEAMDFADVDYVCDTVEAALKGTAA